jgi:hypothetical protein
LVAAVARELGVGWNTVMRAVRDYGTPLVDDPDRPASPVWRGRARLGARQRPAAGTVALSRAN